MFCSVFELYFHSSVSELHIYYPMDTRCKLNLHKTLGRFPGRLLNVLFTFNLPPVFRWYFIEYKKNTINGKSAIWGHMLDPLLRQKMLDDVIQSQTWNQKLFNVHHFYNAKAYPSVFPLLKSNQSDQELWRQEKELLSDVNFSKVAKCHKL